MALASPLGIGGGLTARDPCIARATVALSPEAHAPHDHPRRLLVPVVSTAPLAQAPQEKIDRDMFCKIRAEAAERSQILHTLHMLTDVYGPRLTGSPNLKAASDWVVKRTTEWGLKNAHLEPWDFGHPGWLNERTSAFLLSPGQGLARRRGAGVDAGHERPGHRLGGADRAAGARHAGSADGVLRRQPREGQGQDRVRGRAGESAGHDSALGHAGATMRTVRAQFDPINPTAGGPPGGTANAAAAAIRHCCRPRRSPSSSISSWSARARSRASTMPDAITVRSAPSTTARSTSRRRCRRS